MTLTIAAFCVLGVVAAGDDAPTYERDVRPIFVRRCTICHNARDAGDVELSAGLALDSFEAVRKGTPTNPVFTPGKAAGSSLYDRLLEKDLEKRMPLYEDPLPERERLLIERWIETGAARGEPVALAKTSTAKRAARVVRALDVRVPVDTKVPKGVPGLDQAGTLEVVLKAGRCPRSPRSRSVRTGTCWRWAAWDACFFGTCVRAGRPRA